MFKSVCLGSLYTFLLAWVVKIILSASALSKKRNIDIISKELNF